MVLGCVMWEVGKGPSNKTKIGNKPSKQSHKIQLNVLPKDGNIVFKIHMSALSSFLGEKSVCGRQSFHYGELTFLLRIMASWARFMASSWLLYRSTFHLSVVRQGWSSPCKRRDPSYDDASKSSRRQTASTGVHSLNEETKSSGWYVSDPSVFARCRLKSFRQPKLKHCNEWRMLMNYE
jgi:hypothetical protein